MLSKEVEEFYKKWCLKTKRGGGVLIGTSIKELLEAYTQFLTHKLKEKLLQTTAQ